MMLNGATTPCGINHRNLNWKLASSWLPRLEFSMQCWLDVSYFSCLFLLVLSDCCPLILPLSLFVYLSVSSWYAFLLQMDGGTCWFRYGLICAFMPLLIKFRNQIVHLCVFVAFSCFWKFPQGWIHSNCMCARVCLCISNEKIQWTCKHQIKDQWQTVTFTIYCHPCVQWL